MKIGFDFDNTIVSYDALFHKVALEQSLIPQELLVSKVVVRDYLRKADKEELWTKMQGYVYGARMDDAAAYPGVVEFMHQALDKGISMCIVSHKTRNPFMGPRYDLHEAARNWVGKYLNNGINDLFSADEIFFELTKEEKIARIADTGCDFFIDDLPEILNMPRFPEKTARILFDPENAHDIQEKVFKFGSWGEIKTFFEAQW